MLFLHIAVANLNKYINYLSDDEIINILEATITNSQIIDDKDVQDFVNSKNMYLKLF
jgi:hypothetical protein